MYVIVIIIPAFVDCGNAVHGVIRVDFAGGISGSLFFYKLGSQIIYGSQQSVNQLLSRP